MLEHTIGAYKVDGYLGAGGFGRVFLARHQTTGRQVALKELVNASPPAVEQCRREVGILKKLRHPGLPQVYELFQFSGRWFLAMEYIAGEDLQNKLGRHGAWTWHEIRPLVDRLLDILEYLHVNGVVHRDIKPANIIIRNGRPVLVDFGLAKQASEVTVTAARGFTPAYSPPEQVLGQPTDTRSDLYALGATLYMLLCNRLPPDAMDRLSDDTLNVSALPAGVGEIIAKALALKPPRRFQSAAEMRQAVILADGAMPTKMVQPLSTTVADTSSWPMLPAKSVRSAPCIQVWPAASDATSMDIAAMLIICITVIFGIALALQSWFGYEATMAFLFNGTPLPDAILATKAALLFGGLTLGVIVTLVMCIRWRAWLWAMMLVLPAFYLVLTTAGLIASAFGVTAL